MCLHKIYITTQYNTKQTVQQCNGLRSLTKYMGHSTKLVQSQVGNVLKICMFYSQNFVCIYIVPYLKYTYLVNEPSIFILYFQNVLECFSSPKNCHYRNIVINYSKNVLLLTCSDCVSFPSLKSIFTNIS